MFEKLRESWHQLKEAEPGERFVEHYERRQREGRSTIKRVLFIGAGVVILAAGLVMMVAPGPGILGLFIGGGLVAQEARFMARFLDWAEVKLRAAGRAAIGFWRRSSIPMRVGIVIVAAAVAAGAGYGAYVVVFG